MSQTPVSTRPADPADKALVEAFQEERFNQVNRLDELGRELFKWQLAVPGFYVAALRLADDKALTMAADLGWVFALWFIGLALTLSGVFPSRFRVSPHVADSIAEYLEKAATRKYRFLLAGTAFFFAGIVLAAFKLF